MMDGLLLLAVSLGWSAAQATDSETYRIAGTVVHGISGKPLAKVRVSIAPDRARDRETVLFTGADGSFAFDGVARGKWSLQARREGFGNQTYGQRPGWNSPAVAIVTSPAVTADQLVFRLYPPAVVTGTVTDEFGEPVAGAAVQLFASYVQGGWRRVIPVRSAQTNPAGEYRIWQLPPATYYAAVTATPWFASQLNAAGGDRLAGMGFDPQFFPGTADALAAAPFRLEPGDERAIDFRLRFRKGVRLNIHAPMERGRLTLMAPGPQGSQMFVQRSAQAGIYAFTGVMPGRYRLMHGASNFDDPPRVQEIEVGSADVDVKLALPEPIPVTAAVRAGDIDKAVLRSLQVAIMSVAGPGGQLRMATPDEKIVFPGLTAGRYRLTLFGARGWVYLDTVTAQGARVDTPFIELIDGQPVHLELALKSDGGQVKGEVTSDGKRVSAMGVVLAPREETADFSTYRYYITDLDGSFEFTGLKPGEYLLFTSSEAELEFMDRVKMRADYERATPVHVDPRSSQTIRIDLDGGPATQPAR